MVAATSVPGPMEPQGTAQRPSRPMSTTLRGGRPKCASSGMPMVTPTPKPVTDSANGVMPCTTSSTAPVPLPALASSQSARAFCAPDARSTSDSSSPPPTISSTSSNTGAQCMPAASHVEAGCAKAAAITSSATATPSAAACSERQPASRTAMTVATGKALINMYIAFILEK